MAKKKQNFIKIVYFDESSATDLIYILANGKNTEKKEHIITKATEVAVGAEAEASGKLGLFSALSAKVGGTGGIDFSREGSSIVTKAIENTVLTDYLDCAANTAKDYIRVFENCRPYPYPESFAYFKMLTPYLTMTDGKVVVSQDLSLNLALMDKALDSGRGYYELIAREGSEKYVLRFNIKAFRNNYSISDIVKMNLCYHAIEVGTVSESKLTMRSEFSEQKEAELSGFDIGKNNEQQSQAELKVYDVLLAGVAK